MSDKINYAKRLEKIISDIGSSRTEDDRKRSPRLLLHCCCAPCSSYCLMYLIPYFDITCFFYNPNITDENEYKKRSEELHRFVGIVNRMAEDMSMPSMDTAALEACDISGKDGVACQTPGIPRKKAAVCLTHDISGTGFPEVKIIDGEHEAEEFLRKVSEDDLASAPEGGKRCEMCFVMRLSKTYEVAAAGGFDYFTTTLTISPHKNAQLINKIGEDIAASAAAKCLGESSPIWLPSDFKKNNGYKISIELSKKFGLYRQNYCGCEYSRRN